MSHAHQILDDVTLVPELHEDGKRNYRFMSGPLACQIVKFPKGYKIAEHRHTGPVTWKYLFRGKILYDTEHSGGAQPFHAGNIATLRPNAGTYSGTVEEDAYLLLIERTGSKIVRTSAEPSDLDTLKRFARRPVSDTLGWLRHLVTLGRPTLFVMTYAVVFVVALWLLWPTIDIKTLGISIVASTMFASVQALALGLFRSRPTRRFDGGFRLDKFCTELQQMKRSAVIYSTYSNLFLGDEYWDDFKSAVMCLCDEQNDVQRQIDILLLNPFSYAAKQRRKERKDVDVVAKIVENLNNLRWLTTEYKNGAIGRQRLINVKVTDSLPRHQHHQIDDTVNLAYYPKSHPASSAPYLTSWARSEPGRFAVESFREVWEPRIDDGFETISLQEFFKRYRDQLGELEAAKATELVG